MIFNNPKDICEYYIKEVIKEGDRVIDATVGNGHDTLKLSNAVGKSGLVYGFDIQKAAIESAKKQDYLYDNVKFINDSHENMDSYTNAGVKAILFNLGYLPGGDHQLSTKAETTIPAIKKSMSLIAEGGIIVIAIYRGGDTGFSESKNVIEFLKNTDYKEFNTLIFDYINRPNNPPIVSVIQKKSVN